MWTEKQEVVPRTITSTAPMCDSSTHLIMNKNSGKRAPQYVAALIGSLACLSVGATLGWPSQIANDLLHGKLGFNITESELGWVGSLMHLGAATLSLFSGIIADVIGRKSLMIILVIPATIGWGLLTWANNVYMLYCGRFITGMVTGAFTVLSSMYASEIAQKEIRGALGSYIQLMISFGILFSCVTAPFLNYKLYTLCCAAIPIIFGVLFMLMPETPVYLVKKNKVKKAHEALKQLRGKHYDASKEIIDIQSSLEQEKLHSGLSVITESLKKSTSRKACIIGFGLMFLKSTCGIDAITAYTIYIFTNAKIGLSPSIGVILLGGFQIAASIVQSAVVDRFGRRILLCMSGAVMTLCLLTVGTTLLLKSRHFISEENYTYISYLPLIAIVLFNVSFCFGIGPIPWLMMGEIFPQEIKSLASSGATFVTWITAFAVTKLFILIDYSWGGDIAFFIFALSTALTVLFVLVLVPETKNKSFEEIQRAL